MQERKDDELPALNAARWVAATTVVFGHVTLFLLHPVMTWHDGHIGYVLTTLSRLRFAAVVVFFVISGYLIGGSVLRSPINWRSYSLNRFSRIYIVLIPALALTAMLDGASHHLFANNPVYAQSWPSGVAGRIAPYDLYGVSNILASVFSVESVYTEPMGSNTALWSLGYEWVFYFVFPLLLLPLGQRRSSPLLQLFVIAAFALVLVAIHRPAGAMYWLIWSAGAAAAAAAFPRPRESTMTEYAAGILAAFALIAFIATDILNTGLSLFVIGIAFAALLTQRRFLRLSLNPRIDKTLADCSYSLYVTHMPVVAFLIFLSWRANLLPTSGLPFGVRFLALFSIIVGLALAVALAFERLFERNTARLRKALKGTSKIPVPGS